MTFDQKTLNLSKFSNNQRLRFLCCLGMRLTIMVRAYRVEIDDRSLLVARISAVNEAQHKIFNHIDYTISGKSGYSDDLFLSSLLALSKEGGFEDDFIAAWRFAQKATDGGA
jgi:hypothetical protein